MYPYRPDLSGVHPRGGFVIKKTTIKRSVACCLATLCASAFVPVAAAPAAFRMTTPIPPEITTPDTVDTRIGQLKFFDGIPTPETAQKVYDNLDFMRGVEVFLNGIPGASLVALRRWPARSGRNGQHHRYFRIADGFEVAVPDREY